MNDQRIKTLVQGNLGINYVILFFSLHIGLIAILLLRNNDQYSDAFYWAAILVGIASIPYVIALANKRFIFFEPLYLFLLIGFIGNLVCPLFFMSSLNYDPTTVTTVMKLACIGCAAFLAGYFIDWIKNIAHKMPTKNFEIDEVGLQKFPGKLYFFWVAGIISQFLGLEKLSPALPSLMDAAMKLSISAALAIDVYLYALPKNQSIPNYLKSRCLFRASFFLTAELSRCFLDGFSGRMLPPLVLVILAYIKARKKITPAIMVTLVLIATTFASFVIPFTKTFRGKYWAGENFLTSFNYALENVYNQEDKEKREQSIGRAANALDMAVRVTKLQNDGIKIETYGGIADIVLRYVPRFLWPSKPSVDYNAIGHQMGILSPDDQDTAIGIPLFAGFIMNGMWFGVIVGMLCVGLLLRIYWEWLIVKTEDNFLAFAIYLNLIIVWALCAEDLPLILHANIAFLGYSYIFLGLINKRRAR